MRNRLRAFFGRKARLASIAATVEDSPGWGNLTNRPHDYDLARVQEHYQNSLEAWRKNPLAWRIIAITTDFVVGDSLSISSPLRRLDDFIRAFWYHPQNRLDLRLEAMCDELSRSGDLFVLLFRNPNDGMSYLRFVTKDRILRIETAENDWECELAYLEAPEWGSGESGGAGRRWLSPLHPEAAEAPAVMLHYAVNRPLGALLGESDLATLVPWLQRYSRMLEDRVRLHWALRAFLWMVTVPPYKLREKQEQYRVAPEPGTIIVKDENESWQAVTSQVNASDARYDLQAVRGIIDAGSGYPPHWRGEAADANLATATAMQAPTERHLLRRQRYFCFVLEDILYQAYQRSAQIGRARRLPNGTLPASGLFSRNVPDVSRSDNEALARSARDLAQGLASLQALLGTGGPAFQRQALRLFMKFAGEPLAEGELEEMIHPIHAPGHSPSA